MKLHKTGSWNELKQLLCER